MPCATANRWFVPDQEYWYITEDYALVGEAAEYIRQDILAYDHETYHEWGQGGHMYLRDRWANFHYSSGCYYFAQQGTLVYADVDQSNPDHKKRVYGKLAKEPSLDKESDKAEAIQKEAVKFLEADYRANPRNSKLSDDEGFGKDCLAMTIETARLTVPLVDFLIQFKDEDGIKVLLNILSDQSKRKSPRPVMILIGMIDKAKTDKRGLTEGWAIGYDFLEGNLIIKPFISKKDHHPLGNKWHAEAVNDGISFKGTPAVFADKFVELSSQVADKPEIDGLKLLVHTSVADWILQQWKGFSLATPDKWTEAFEKSIKNAKKTIFVKRLDGEEAAITEKVGDAKLSMEAFENFANRLAAEEPRFRSSALDARENGKAEAAQNAAEVYDRLTKDLKSFNENPVNQF